MGNIIGRKQEIRELNDLYNSDKAQMVAAIGNEKAKMAVDGASLLVGIINTINRK